MSFTVQIQFYLSVYSNVTIQFQIISNYSCLAFQIQIAMIQFQFLVEHIITHRYGQNVGKCMSFPHLFFFFFFGSDAVDISVAN